MQRGLLLQHFFLGLSRATLLAFTGVLLLGLKCVLGCVWAMSGVTRDNASFVNRGLNCQNWQT
ncbi:hypothetical protein CCUG60885_01205 [Mycobacteroides salmoniphilum]|uniref:Uncharacterized protein n=1 Tax=Mycobacteroides salmoniphilum TaxID=404941 RepID=A0A4R8SK31_9MYCO|nr:hypothetical protein CCUG60885_01205 [Mycobacteroides salmoniphilum]TEA01886.1 hypothetical protein CCUG60883_04425 [Mycobacteroides salmoniphilum]